MVSSDGYAQLSLAMQTYSTICLCFSLSFILLDAHTVSSACAMLKLVDKESLDNVFEVREDGYVNITFVLKTESCHKIKDCFKVKVSVIEKGFPVPFCTIVFNGACSKTDHSLACHCLSQSQKLVGVYRKVSPTDSTILLEWADCRNEINGNFSFSITRFMRNEGELGTKEIIGICFGGVIVLVVAAVFIKIRLCGAQGTYDIASYRDRQEIHSYEVIRGRGHGLQVHASEPGVADANEARGSTSAENTGLVKLNHQTLQMVTWNQYCPRV